MQSPVQKGIAAAAVLTISLIIAGCASTGGKVPQDSAIAPSSLDAGAAIRAANAEAQWPAADWWRAYNDPQLNAWVDAAQAGNPTLAIAQARVRQAQSLAGVAHAAFPRRSMAISRSSASTGRTMSTTVRVRSPMRIPGTTPARSASRIISTCGARTRTPTRARSTAPMPAPPTNAPRSSNSKRTSCGRISACR